jgi:hypothetical protein
MFDQSLNWHNCVILVINNKIYNLSEYLIDILYVLKTDIAWCDLRSHIDWNSVYKTYVKLNSFNIFKKISTINHS